MAAVCRLDAHLQDRQWIVGDAFGLADIVWMGNAHRLALTGFPAKSFPHYREWVRRVAQRDSYKQGLVCWEAAALRLFWGVYTRYRRITGTDFRSYM